MSVLMSCVLILLSQVPSPPSIQLFEVFNQMSPSQQGFPITLLKITIL